MSISQHAPKCRCVYCGRKIAAYYGFAHHEADCDMRKPMRRHWARKIGEALQRERDEVRRAGRG